MPLEVKPLDEIAILAANGYAPAVVETVNPDDRGNPQSVTFRFAGNPNLQTVSYRQWMRAYLHHLYVHGLGLFEETILEEAERRLACQTRYLSLVGEIPPVRCEHCGQLTADHPVERLGSRPVFVLCGGWRVRL